MTYSILHSAELQKNAFLDQKPHRVFYTLSSLKLSRLGVVSASLRPCEPSPFDPLRDPASQTYTNLLRLQEVGGGKEV